MFAADRKAKGENVELFEDQVKPGLDAVAQLYFLGHGAARGLADAVIRCEKYC